MNGKSRRYHSRDRIKICIIKYLFEKDNNSMSSKYELLHHSGIGMYDYPYLEKILNEMLDVMWIKVSFSGNSSKKKYYSLDDRGQEMMQFLYKLESNNPLYDLDLFVDI
jgi:DNA-binding PadR family transcriptional regulator